MKNLFDVAGHTTLAGAELLSDRPPAASDSWAVRQLHSAGALLSGMLNMDALRLRLHHRKQPLWRDAQPGTIWLADRRRFFGGSAAAWRPDWSISASAATPTARFASPRRCAGSLASKPTFGRLSPPGSHPFVASLDHIGPFARRVADLAAVYDAPCRDATRPMTFRPIKPASAPATCLERGLEGCAARGWGLFHHLVR